VDDRAVALGPWVAPRDEGGIVVVWYEADLLTIRLLCDRQPPQPRVLADGGLGSVADRENGARQLILCQREQEVRLVLCGVCAALQQIAADGSIALHAGIVTGGDRVGAEPARPLDQRGELQVAVTVGARNRRAAGSVLADEVRHDFVVELPLEIE